VVPPEAVRQVRGPAVLRRPELAEPVELAELAV